jgi:serine-type D-Ala-D-Ala carboxypeptidase/endopeptidase (penicillin-binding protein 4)
MNINANTPITISRMEPGNCSRRRKEADFPSPQSPGSHQQSCFETPRLSALSASLRFSVALLSLLLALSIYAQPTATPKAPTTLAELQQRLTEQVTHPRFAAGTFAVKIVSLDTGKTWFEHDAHKLVSPASNSKLYTMALALDKLGGDYRIRTSLYAAAKPDAASKLPGDLILYGRGDPGFNTRRFNGDIFRVLQPLVAALTNSGVREITGDLIADESYLIGSRYGAGWVLDDLNYYYGAEISALTINDNILRATAKPGAIIGAPAELSFVPANDYLLFSNRTQTVATNGPRTLTFHRPIEQNIVYVTGTIPLRASEVSATVTVPDPAQLFAALFRESLARNGIKVNGKTRTANWLTRQAQPLNFANLIELGAVESQPMRELNKEVQKPSQNLYTDLMLAHIGALERDRAQARREAISTTATSEELGIRELDKFLAKIGVKRGDVRFEEGSGLSRNNLLTANATITLLQHMSRHPEAAAYLDALPIAGVDGTLRNRMKGTRAEGNVRAKTGTLRWANGLSGYVTTAAGERLAFSLTLNRYAPPSAENSARAELDNVALLLADFAGRGE